MILVSIVKYVFYKLLKTKISRMINLHFCNGKVFVWNAEDAYTLRKEHRIIGSLVGCYPSKTFQNETKWLPLQLLPEESKLLINKGIAQLISIPAKVEDPTTIETFFNTRDKLFEEQIIIMKENRRKEILEKADVIYEGKKRKLLETLGKKKKVQKDSPDSSSKKQHSLVETEDLPREGDVSNTVDESQKNIENESKDNESEAMETDSTHESEPQIEKEVELDKNAIIESEPQIEKEVVIIESEPQIEKEVAIIESEPQIEKEVAIIESEPQIEKEVELDKNAIIEAELAKIPEVGKELCMVQLFTEAPWKNTTTPVNWKYPSTEAEKLRYAVYSDLWEKGYYITTGTKFGGDFLAYEGDPLKYHALYIIVCIPVSQRLQGSDIVVYGRLGHQVKKTAALASLNIDGEVDYVSISWEGEVM